jgi:hypothetical protein
LATAYVTIPVAAYDTGTVALTHGILTDSTEPDATVPSTLLGTTNVDWPILARPLAPVTAVPVAGLDTVNRALVAVAIKTFVKLKADVLSPVTLTSSPAENVFVAVYVTTPFAAEAAVTTAVIASPALTNKPEPAVTVPRV